MPCQEQVATVARISASVSRVSLLQLLAFRREVSCNILELGSRARTLIALRNGKLDH